MSTVALIGPDGAGKTTICQQLEHSLPVPVKYLYMGVSLDSSNVMLPTSRLVRAFKRALGAPPDKAGPPDPMRVKPPAKNWVRRSLSGLKSVLGLVNRLSEEWYRQGLAWYYQRRGNIVVFDRHYFPDYYAYDISTQNTRRSLTQRIHGFMLMHVYPKPDLIIYLDAPAEVLFQRKGEGSVEALERRRHDYLQIRNLVRHFVVVDASQPLDEVTRAVSTAILDHHRSAGRRSPKDE